MARNALQADDVLWLLRTVKIKQCEAFGCGNQKKNRKDMSISFHVFPNDNTDYAVFGFKLSEERLYQKVPVCVMFDADCFEYTRR